MLDYQQIVDDLRSAVAAAGPDSFDMLRICAADYTVACNEANDRLRQIGALLKQGLRSEAIQLCDIEPNLLDVMATLDFPDRGAIGPILKRAGIQPPPALQVDVASELNEAYAQQEPLEAMLGQHRLLAIARAPLALRLKTLRRLAALDPNTPVWCEDLAEFESERLKEIQKEADPLVRRGDLPAIKGLVDELKRPGWRDPAAGVLLKSLSKSAESLSNVDTRKALERLAEEMNIAFSELDITKARTIRDQWEVYADLYSISPNDPLVEQVAPALAWMREADQGEEQQQRFTIAVSALEQALDRHWSAPTGERTFLTRAFYATQGFEMEVPQHLFSRYQARIQALDLAVSRKSRLAFTGIIVAGCAVVSIIGIIIWQQLRSAEVAEHVASLTKMVADGRITAADQAIQQLQKTKPYVVESAAVQELASQVAKQIHDENQRQRQLADAVNKVKAAGFDLPDTVSLEQARQLAKSTTERVEIAELDAKIAAAKRMSQRDRDDEFLGKLNGLVDQVRQLEGRRNVPIEETSESLKLIATELAALDATAGLVSAPVRAQVTPLKTRLETLQANAERRRQEDALLANINSRIGDVAGFKAALASYVKEFSTSPRAADFKRVEMESAAWPLLTQWNDYDQEFAIGARGGIVDRAAKLLERTEAALPTFAKSPHGLLLEERIALLKSLKSRKDDEGQPIVAELQSLFKDGLIFNVWYVELSEGYYYTRTKIDAGAGQFEHIKGFDYATQGRAPDNNNRIKSVGRAPQSIVADNVLPVVERLAKSNDLGTWEDSMRSIAKEVLESKQLDPILGLTILKRIIDVGNRGSRHLAESWRDAHHRLENCEVDFLARWMDPRDDAAIKTRPTAKSELAGLVNLVKYAEDAAAKAAEKDLRLLETTSYQWVGWLRRSEQGGMSCVIPRSLAENLSGELVVIPQQPGDSLDTIYKLGVVQAGVARLDHSATAAMVEGRPVWLVSRSTYKADSTPLSP